MLKKGSAGSDLHHFGKRAKTKTTSKKSCEEWGNLGHALSKEESVWRTGNSEKSWDSLVIGEFEHIVQRLLYSEKENMSTWHKHKNE